MMESKRLEHLIIRLLGIVVISAMVMSAYAVNRVKELEDQLARFGIAQVSQAGEPLKLCSAWSRETPSIENIILICTGGKKEAQP